MALFFSVLIRRKLPTVSGFFEDFTHKWAFFINGFRGNNFSVAVNLYINIKIALQVYGTDHSRIDGRNGGNDSGLILRFSLSENEITT